MTCLKGAVKKVFQYNRIFKKKIMSNSHILIKVFLCGFLISTFSIVRAQNTQDSTFDETIQFIEKSHSLYLPDWGPYTKRYVGISHLPGDNEGIRFDLSVFPGYYRRKVEVPNVFHESGYHPWEVSSDLGEADFARLITTTGLDIWIRKKCYLYELFRM